MYLRIEEHRPDSMAVAEDGGKEYTYGDLVEFCDYFGRLVPERNVIFILCRNVYAAVAAHVACIENRIVPLMLSAQMDHELLENLIQLYQPRYLWLPVENESRYPVVSVREGYKLVQTEYAAYPVNEELAMLLATSGSTGSPKLVRHSYRNLASNARNVADVFGFSSKERAMIDLPLHYTMGLNVACSNLYAGGALMMTTRSILEKGYWDFFHKAQITNMCGVPYSYEMLSRMKFFGQDHPSLRIIAEGGGKLTDDLFHRIAEYASHYGKRFYATFGTSETTARLAFLEPEMAARKTGSIGKAIPGGRLFLTDDDGNEMKDREGTGELVYAGPNVTLGYAQCREDLCKGDEFQGVYHTGDLARRDQEGFYYIEGRKSRFLKLFGHRVGLDEAERIIKAQYHMECACAGDDKHMHIYITKKGYAEEVRHFISVKTGIQISAFRVMELDGILKNESGKVLYQALPKYDR